MVMQYVASVCARFIVLLGRAEWLRTVLDVVKGDVDFVGRKGPFWPEPAHVDQVLHRTVVRRPAHMQR